MFFGVWAVLGKLCFSISAHNSIVINEIHYNPDIKTELVEFIELYNAGTNDVDLSGWYFSSSIGFTFLEGTVLATNAYVVVAQSPAALQKKFGVASLGPWTGLLSNAGEKLILRNRVGEIEDEVDYQLGFPWPTVGDPPGYSIELLNPVLDNNLGGSWRSWTVGSMVTNEAGIVQGLTNTFSLMVETNMWKYDQSGSDLGTAWQSPGYDDSTWPAGAALLYVEGATLPWPKNTLLTFKTPPQITYYFRSHFNCATNPASLTSLRATVLLDDGAVFYLNGRDVGRIGMSGGTVTYTTGASRNVGDATSPDYLDIPTDNLMPGDNSIAVEVHQSNTNSTDIVFGMKLDALSVTATNLTTNYVVVTNVVSHGPTPGRRNAAFTANVPPQIRQVDHHPTEPKSGEPVVITAKVTDPDGISEVSLAYQLVDPGNYIALTDPAYRTSWTIVSMNDRGEAGDEIAGDGVYTAVLPASLQTHRRLVRYRITATDALGNSVSAPYADDPQPNFAYYVYDGVPAWQAAVRPGATPVVTFDTNIMQRLPVYQLISKSNSVVHATWIDRYAGALYQWSGTLVYDGKVYDHIHYRARGGVWRYAMGKNMWKFDFNRGHDFQARDNYGQKYNTPWNKLNLGACIQQGDYYHRGEQGMFESVGFRLFNLAGVAAPKTHLIHFRIVDDTAEANPSDQYQGDFWGLYLAVEQENGRFLDEHNLPDGNLYKIEGGGVLSNEGLLGPSDNSDLNRFMSSYSSNPADAWWRTNFNLPQYYGMQTIVQGVHQYDIASGKNYFYYHNPETGLWSEHPWDMDLTWADNMYIGGQQGGGEPFKGLVLTASHPAFQIEYGNRVREIRDLLFNTDQTYQLIDEVAGILRDLEGGPSFLDADRSMWDYNPVMVSGYVDSGKAGQGRFYQFPLESSTNSAIAGSFEGTVRLMKNYVVYRGGLLDSWTFDAAVPGTPAASYEGPTNYPVNRLSFRTSTFMGVSGAFVALKWRLAEVTPTNQPAFDPSNPRKYEIQADWESQEMASFSNTITLPANLAKVGHTYRVRVRMKDTTGRWSHWSVPVEFAAGEPDTTAMLRDYLRVTELMPNPPGGSGYEFIELHNTSTNDTLNLAGAKFTQGIDFTFADGVAISPGGYVLVVKAASTNNFAAFRTYYHLSGDVPIVGPYSGSLGNNGETITLKNAAAGTDILSFTYGNGRGWPVAADGAGHSLVPVDGALSGETTGSLEYGGNWRSSAYLGGSPGQPDPSLAPTLVINEVMANTRYSNPGEPEFDSNDWIELYNPTATNLVLGSGWYLSDDSANLKKWAIPPATVSARGWLGFDEVNGFHQPITNGFGINQAGETVYLSYLPGTVEDRIVDVVRFKGQEPDASVGRYPDGGAYWFAMDPTRESANAIPLARVVISELMYHPPSVSTNAADNTMDEYIELFNATPASVNFFNTNGVWRIDGGVKYQFPTNLTLASGQCLLVVNFDPTNAPALAAFRTLYGLTNDSAVILGPYAGKLNNATDRVALERPQAPDVSGDPLAWVMVDEVIYSDQTPWPTGADGTGASLQRLSALGSGNDPSNWRVAAPAAGHFVVVPPLVSIQAVGTGLESSGAFRVRFEGVAGVDWILQASTNLVEWSSLATNPILNGLIDFVDDQATNYSLRFYRVREDR